MFTENLNSFASPLFFFLSPDIKYHIYSCITRAHIFRYENETRLNGAGIASTPEFLTSTILKWLKLWD
jgi:hypothetical protein